MSHYVPEPPPTGGPDEKNPMLEALAAYVFRELEKISREISSLEDGTKQILHVEPSRPRDGMVIFADGTDFNPGGGAGLYSRVGEVWVKL